MTNLRIQRRLAATVLKVGQNKIFVDPTALTVVARASSRSDIRTLISEKLIVARGVTPHSRSRARAVLAQKVLGRHRGFGNREGASNARAPVKVAWMERQRILRRLLRKYRAQGKVDAKVYRSLYVRAKGNQFKNKRVLIDFIHNEKDEAILATEAATQAAAHREKTRRKRDARDEARSAKQTQLAAYSK